MSNCVYCQRVPGEFKRDLYRTSGNEKTIAYIYESILGGDYRLCIRSPFVGEIKFHIKHCPMCGREL